jgi:hypothetical protein
MKGLRLGSLDFERSWALVNAHVPKVLPKNFLVDTLDAIIRGQTAVSGRGGEGSVVG